MQACSSLLRAPVALRPGPARTLRPSKVLAAARPAGQQGRADAQQLLQRQQEAAAALLREEPAAAAAGVSLPLEPILGPALRQQPPACLLERRLAQAASFGELESAVDAAEAGWTTACLLASLRSADRLQRLAACTPAAPAKDQAPSRHLVAALARALEQALRERQPETAVDALLVWSTLRWNLPQKVGKVASGAVLHLAPQLDGTLLLRLAAAYAGGRIHDHNSWQLSPKAAEALQAALERQLPHASPAAVALLLVAGPWLLPPEQLAHPPASLEAALLRTAAHMSAQQAAAAHAAAERRTRHSGERWQLSTAVVEALRRRSGQPQP